MSDNEGKNGIRSQKTETQGQLPQYQTINEGGVLYGRKGKLARSMLTPTLLKKKERGRRERKKMKGKGKRPGEEKT